VWMASLVVFVFESETDIYAISNNLRLILNCSLLFKRSKSGVPWFRIGLRHLFDFSFETTMASSKLNVPVSKPYTKLSVGPGHDIKRPTRRFTTTSTPSRYHHKEDGFCTILSTL
jgi:hypothetical protein